jgi:hypothetical protein
MQCTKCPMEIYCQGTSFQQNTGIYVLSLSFADSHPVSARLRDPRIDVDAACSILHSIQAEASRKLGDTRAMAGPGNSQGGGDAPGSFALWRLLGKQVKG